MVFLAFYLSDRAMALSFDEEAQSCVFAGCCHASQY
jgi:hypothetical protein